MAPVVSTAWWRRSATGELELLASRSETFIASLVNLASRSETSIASLVDLASRSETSLGSSKGAKTLGRRRR